MTRLTRRAFVSALTRAGLGSAALASLPPWARSALAAGRSGARGLATPLGETAAAPDLIERNDRPEHWETTLAALGRSWLTPNEAFFVRSHHYVPSIETDSYRLEIAGLVRAPLSLSLAELKAGARTEAVHTLECAGNGRGRYHLPNTSGTQWEYGAVGTARWGGLKLASLLERAGVLPEAHHVWFEAADHGPLPGVPVFLRSIPLEKAMKDVLLADTMNGSPLPRLHGAPLRAIVPGWFGMASTKWVTKVRVEAGPSDNFFMAKGYHYVYPGEDPAKAPPVEDIKVKSLITRPLEGAALPRGRLRVQGFAWAGEAGLGQVEVSSDGGAHWRPARLVGESQPLAWREWAAEIEAPKPGRLTILARATDGAGEVQPVEAKANASGYGNNSIHRVSVEVR